MSIEPETARHKSDRLESLRMLLDTLDAQDGPLPDDPAEDDRLRRLLAGPA